MVFVTNPWRVCGQSIHCIKFQIRRIGKKLIFSKMAVKETSIILICSLIRISVSQFTYQV